MGKQMKNLIFIFIHIGMKIWKGAINFNLIANAKNRFLKSFDNINLGTNFTKRS